MRPVVFGSGEIPWISHLLAHAVGGVLLLLRIIVFFLRVEHQDALFVIYGRSASRLLLA